MLDFAATWVEVLDEPSDVSRQAASLRDAARTRLRHYERYPDESLAQWHARLGLTDEKGE